MPLVRGCSFLCGTLWGMHTQTLPALSIRPVLYFEHTVAVDVGIEVSKQLPEGFGISVEHEAYTQAEIDIQALLSADLPHYVLAVRNLRQDALMGYVQEVKA